MTVSGVWGVPRGFHKGAPATAQPTRTLRGPPRTPNIPSDLADLIRRPAGHHFRMSRCPSAN
eukprot:15481508-Alexandrium_andersonii.AAC.1